MADNEINYYRLSLEEIAKINPGERPRLLVQTCCGPCACFPLTFLCPRFEVTLYYNNSNIFPPSEYEKRLGELKKLLSYLERDFGYRVNLITPKYDNETYMKELIPYGNCEEGGERCRICYRKRMKEAYDYAEKEGFDYFCTVMTISRQKDSKTLNLIGNDLEKEHLNTRYFYSDFKKKGGIEMGVKLREKYGLYCQNYCGCIFSFNEMKKRTSAKEDEHVG